MSTNKDNLTMTFDYDLSKVRKVLDINSIILKLKLKLKLKLSLLVDIYYIL